MKIAVLYHYYEANSVYRNNLAFFLKFGCSEHLDIFISNSSKNKSLEIPKRPNIFCKSVPNSNRDFGGHGRWLRDIEVSNYDYFFFINSSVRGPFVPSCFPGFWWDPFVDLLAQGTSLVGSTINFLDKSSGHGYAFTKRFSDYDQASHVQSMIFAVGRNCLGFLQDHVFSKALLEMPRDDVVLNYEILMSQLILRDGGSIGCLLPGLGQLFEEQVEQRLTSGNLTGDLFMPDAYMGRSLHPYETIFFKTTRDVISQAAMDDLIKYQMASGRDEFPNIEIVKEDLKSVSNYSRRRILARAVREVFGIVRETGQQMRQRKAD